ncbi:MAG: hypothetical protein PUK86_09525, partial [bacterium]|nr:hypothetical protein [bacterium]
PFSREKIVSLQFLRPEISKTSAKTGEGGSGGGACFPVHQLVKTFFDKLGSNRRFEPSAPGGGVYFPVHKLVKTFLTS